MMKSPEPPRTVTTNIARRIALLLACISAGLVIGAIGNSISGNPAWYIAIPAVVAVGWIFLANPTECEAPANRGTRSPPDGDAST